MRSLETPDAVYGEMELVLTDEHIADIRQQDAWTRLFGGFLQEVDRHRKQQ